MSKATAMKDAVIILVSMAVGSIACAIETWLEKRQMDALSSLFLGTFTVSLIMLGVVLIMHFGRFGPLQLF